MSNYKNKKLKLLDENNKECDFRFVKSSDDYDGLADFERVKSVFATNLCFKCFERMNRKDFDNNNYEFWINSEQSFLNLDDFNFENNTKLEAVFHINKISHKVCRKKDYHEYNKKESKAEIIEEKINPQTFLKDKEYWVEEKPSEWTLFVKFKDKIYQGSVSKQRAMMFKNDNDMKIVIVNLVLSNIRLQITKDENIEKLINRNKVSECYKEKLRQQQDNNNE